MLRPFCELLRYITLPVVALSWQRHPSPTHRPPRNRPTPFGYQIAWRDEAGVWQYPDIVNAEGEDTVAWPALQAMLQNRFIDHPRLTSDIRNLVLPLQKVGTVEEKLGKGNVG